MKFRLTNEEISMLKAEEIDFDPEHDYSTDEEQEDFMGQVRYLEIKYVSKEEAGEDVASLLDFFSGLADKVQDQVPDD